MTIVAEGMAKQKGNGKGTGSSGPLIVFVLDERRYALDLRAVERVVHALAVQPVVGAPDALLGMVRVGGATVPVVNTRVCLGGAPRPARFGDHLLVLGRGSRSAALVVDAVVGIVDPRTHGLAASVPSEGEARAGFVRARLEPGGTPVDVCDIGRFFDAAEAAWGAGPPRAGHSS